jgi:glycosyltransferase involved in cell wall biosynthesis
VSARVLFVSHDATRTGSPILLLHILRWLSRNTSIQWTTLLVRGGDLESEFAALGPVHRLSPPSPAPLPKRAVRRLLARLDPAWKERERTRTVRRVLDDFRPDLIYANTAVSAAFLTERNLTGDTPLLCHLHELSYVIDSMVGRAAFARAVPRIQHFICVAEAVRQNLTGNFGVEPARTSLVREPIRTAAARAGGREVRRELGLPESSFVVMCAGTADWRKGPDLFIQTARLVNAARPAYFVWIGRVDPRTELMVAHDIRRLGLDGRVLFVGVRSAMEEYLAAADVFFLPSREDPYPLVCLEAASHGKPIICFAGGGGMPEFVREDAGFVVPYLDLAAAAQRILSLEADSALRAAFGVCARERARESDIDVIGPQIRDRIDALLAARGREAP